MFGGGRIHVAVLLNYCEQITQYLYGVFAKKAKTRKRSKKLLLFWNKLEPVNCYCSDQYAFFFPPHVCGMNVEN